MASILHPAWRGSALDRGQNFWFAALTEAPPSTAPTLYFVRSNLRLA